MHVLTGRQDTPEQLTGHTEMEHQFRTGFEADHQVFAATLETGHTGTGGRARLAETVVCTALYPLERRADDQRSQLAGKCLHFG